MRGLRTYSNETVTGLELERLFRVVDQSETSRLSSTELGAEAEDDDLFLGSLVHGRELVTEFVFRDVGTGRVKNIYNHLLPLKETVGDELASPNSNSTGGVLKINNQPI